MSRSGSVKTTGLAEFKQAVERLPAAVEAACRKVARDTALRVAAEARRRVPVDTGQTRDSIVVRPRVEQKRYEVEAGSARHGRAANVAIWLEYGTVKMSARPFMRPALDGEQDRYRRELEAEVSRTAQEILK